MREGRRYEIRLLAGTEARAPPDPTAAPFSPTPLVGAITEEPVAAGGTDPPLSLPPGIPLVDKATATPDTNLDGEWHLLVTMRTRDYHEHVTCTLRSTNAQMFKRCGRHVFTMGLCRASHCSTTAAYYDSPPILYRYGKN